MILFRLQVFLLIVIYNIFISILLLFSPIFYLFRFYKKKETLLSFCQKFLPYLPPLPPKQFDFHFHAASVGELKSFDFLIRNNISQKKQILITTTTLKSVIIAENYNKKYVTHRFSPLDFLPFQIFFFWKYSAKKIIIADSEIWPNFFITSRIFGKKITLFNARMSTTSRKMWHRFSLLFEFLLKSVEIILPQSLMEKDFFARFHNNVRYFGNLKMINLRIDNPMSENFIISNFKKNKKKLCVISTHDGEDELLILQILPYIEDFDIIYCPRHCHRSNDISHLLHKYQISNSLLSSFVDGKKCLIVDEIGLLDSVFMVAEIVIMAGAFLPHLKGHNVMEPASFGCKIITGFYVESFQQTVDEMVNENAILQCDINNICDAIAVVKDKHEFGLNAKNYVIKNMPNRDDIINIING